MLTIPGWKPVLVNFIDPRWEAVKDHTVPPIDGLVPSPQAVNEWVNGHVRYVKDPDGGDHWQPPEETLQLMQGDCEDFAILKRALMIAGGWPKEGIAFFLVDDLIARLEHAFIVAGAMILDNRTNVLQPIAKAEDYAPRRMFTEEGTFHFLKE